MGLLAESNLQSSMELVVTLIRNSMEIPPSPEYQNHHHLGIFPAKSASIFEFPAATGDFPALSTAGPAPPRDPRQIHMLLKMFHQLRDDLTSVGEHDKLLQKMMEKYKLCLTIHS